MLTGAAANGLYTVAGVILTVAAESLRGFLRAIAWLVWITGGVLTACALAGAVTGIAIATTVLFALFCPWVALLGHSLQLAHPTTQS
jgi:hypothetical protein